MPWAGGHVISASEDVRELIRACADSNDSCVWERFIARFERPISLSVIRTAKRWGEAAEDVVADLIQETYLRLCEGKCALLYRFVLEHPEAVDGYVKTIAANLAHDYFKTKHATKNGAGAVLQLKDECDPVAPQDRLGGAGAMERGVLLREIELSLDHCTEGPMRERDRTIFWLYYRQGMTANAIASLPAIGLTVKGVESAILRMTRQVRAHMLETRGEVAAAPVGSRGSRVAKSF